MLPLMLVDTRDERPEPPAGGGGAWAAVVAAVGRLFPWPALIAWLFAGTVLLHDLAGMTFGMVTIAVCAWRAANAYPRWGGLSDHKQ